MTGILRRLARALWNSLALFGVVWAVVTFTPLTRWMGAQLMGPWNAQTGDVLVILGADTPSDGQIGLASYWRAFYAVQAWQNGSFNAVVVSGGTGIADSIAEYLRCSGVPAERITLERKSQSTRENALFTAPVLSKFAGRKVLLTTDYHVFRSVRSFRRAGVDVISVPVPYALKRSNSLGDRWPLFIELLIELAKIGVYWFRGWI